MNDYALYTWDAAGNKLAKKVYGNTAGNTTRYDYSGNFLYENSVLKAIFTTEGRIVSYNNNGSVLWNYEYNLKDHLGNTRVVFTAHSDGKPETNQITSYDPFGFVTTQTNCYPTGAFRNKYLYNGKELQDDQLAGLKVDWYYYGARMYDAQLGRWHVIDPLAEKYESWSTYQYVRNNPILWTDPNGMNDDGYIVDEEGRTKRVDNTGGKDFDVLYKKYSYFTGKKDYDSKGTGDKGIKLNKGILDKELTQVSKDEGNGKIEQTTYQFTGDNEGEGLFRFLSKNTKVEWSLIQYGEISGDNGKNLLLTTHTAESIVSSLEVFNYVNFDLRQKIRYDVHNHPSGSHAASPGDGKSWSIIWNLNNPNAKCGIYTSQDNSFIQYYPKKRK